MRFQVGDATRLPFADGSFDAVTMIHVGMNIDAKGAVIREMARVVGAGGTAIVYEIMRIGDGDRNDDELAYPLPWAADASTSFLTSPNAYAAALEQSGLSVRDTIDRSELVRAVLASARAAPPAVHLMGPGWPEMFGNLVAAFNAGRVAPIQLTVARV